jgi:DNA-binding MarR family transcriptional regulator
MAVAKRKIEKAPVLNKQMIETGLALMVFAHEREIDRTSELRLYFEVARAQLEGEPVTLATLVRLTKTPFSTASRVMWDLSQKGLIRYESHSTDRRKKLLVAIIP